MQIIRGILLLSLLTLFGIIVWGRRPQVSANLQSPLPTVVADPIADEPCLTATDADFVFDFYGFVHGRDNTTTLTYSVTNLNQKDISYVAFDSRYFVYTGGEYRSLPKGDVTTPRYILWVFDTVTGERWPIQEPYPLPFGYGFSPILSPATNQLAYIGMVEPDDCFFNDSAYFADPLCQYRGFSLYAADLETGNVTWIADNVGKHTWSPDGSAIAYTQLDEQDQVDLWITHLQDGQTIQLTDSPARETAVIWIPER